MTSTYTRWLCVVVGVGAACALVLATQVTPWWSFTEAHVYLLRAERCFGGECQPAGLAWLSASAWWYRLGAATFGMGSFAALLAVFVAGARAAGRRPKTASTSLLLTVVLGLVCAAGAWLTFPKLAPLSWTWGPPLFALGLGLATASAVLARRAAPPERA